MPPTHSHPRHTDTFSQDEIVRPPNAYQRRLLADRADVQRRVVAILVDSADLAKLKLANRISDCCRTSTIGTKDDGTLRVVEMRCKSKLCPICARRRAAAVFHRVQTAVRKMNSARFITLTLAHSQEPLREQLLRLRRAFAELRRSKLWKQGVVGGIYTLEITFNRKRREWHPHLHVIADGNFISRKLLAEQWHRVTGDSFIVDIRKVHSVKEAAKYISKYVAKTTSAGELEDDRLIEWVEQVRDIRFVQAFGNLHATKLDERDKCPMDEHAIDPIGRTADVARAADRGDREAAAILKHILQIRKRPISIHHRNQPAIDAARECEVTRRLRDWFSKENARSDTLSRDRHSTGSGGARDRPKRLWQEPDAPAHRW